ncbi:hypothetical protein GOEFS_106_00650 [Gordonia effusa NBRC 100432]|uniref:AB hydrolase-1 domain-containing protein n=1 Tax=Gordonia effusa NBRC 100432 TaxID=1077974 RepID=H0R517_9ACTN|nr:hypothetical protein GOEFS_106_00650 [Gordonia effusa NBRC 100432]
MTYQTQRAWREIQSFLPADYQIPEDDQPAEEWWDYQGHSIHLDTYRNPDAAVKVILFHGVGTNGRQMSMILGRPLAHRGLETIAVDMPTFGVTSVAPGSVVTYDDWVDIGSALVQRELARDDRPIILYGLSAGGAETFHVAARGGVRGIVGMTFLDQRDKRVALDTAHDPITGRLTPTLKTLAKTPLRKVRVPMRLVSKMRTLVNDPAALKVFYRDKSSAGNWASVAFLDSYMHYQPDVEPVDFDVCPVLHTQPADDRWTPADLSEPLLGPIRKVEVSTVTLTNAGHFPIEQPGLDELVAAVYEFAIGVGVGG